VVKFVKILTAFGLILSLLIVSVAAILGLIAAIVALSRGGHDRHRTALLSRAQTIFYSVRQLLWCYAMFGHNLEGQDPFLQEIAYDLALVSSVCCGNPGSLWFWMNANRLQQRRYRMRRGWVGPSRQETQGDEGVALVQRGVWGRGVDTDERDNIQSEDYRGLLSVAVEFLFGPNPFDPGPTEAEKSKLRAAVILDKYNQKAGVSLKELSPYIDDPGTKGLNSPDVLSGCLAVVVHFHGIPETNEDPKEVNNLEASFIFPELLAESSYITTYEEKPSFDDGSFQALLYKPSVHVMTRSQGGQVPTSLEERRYRLTGLESHQFIQCAVLGTLNLIGVVWLRQSLKTGGVLAEFLGDNTVVGFLGGFAKILVFYAFLFFALPVGRMVIVLVYNGYRERRNIARAEFALALRETSTSNIK